MALADRKRGNEPFLGLPPEQRACDSPWASPITTMLDEPILGNIIQRNSLCENRDGRGQAAQMARTISLVVGGIRSWRPACRLFSVRVANHKGFDNLTPSSALNRLRTSL
jgi:hypothetical protein